MGPFVAQSLAAFVSTLTMFSAGMIFGWTSPSLPKLLNPEDKNELKLTPDEGSWMVSITSLGCIFGPIIINLFADRIGRKWSLNIVVLPMLLSWLTLGLMTNVDTLYVGRFMGGLGIGAVYALMPMYLGEIAEDRIRGALGTLMSTMLNIGMLLSYSVGPWVSRRMLCVISAVPPLLFLVLFPWMPETPYFLLMKGDREKAVAALVWLRRRTDVNEELMALESNAMKQKKCKDGFGITKLLKERSHRQALRITVGLLTIQQFCGVIAILSYASLIFEDSGLTGWSNVSAIIIGIVQVFGGIAVFFVVDVAGRRPILMFSSVFSTFFLTLEAVFFHLKSAGYETASFSWTPLLGIIGFYLCFIPGFGSIPYAMIGELFPTNVKAPATMLVSIYGSLMGFIVAKIYQVAGSAVGIHWIFYLFAVTALTGVPFVYFCVPETKMLSLEEIQQKLHSGCINSRTEPDVPKQTKRTGQ